VIHRWGFPEGFFGMIPFTACFAVVLILETLRFCAKVNVPRLMIGIVAIAGLLLQSTYLWRQIFFHHGHVFDSVRGWMLTVSWGGMILYLYFLLRKPRTPSGLFLVPLSLIAIALAVHFADATPFPGESVGSWWRTIHGLSFVLATVASFAGFMTGMMYFLQISSLKRKRPATGSWKLPSIEWLQTANSRSIVFLLFALGLGIFSGFAINRLNISAKPMISPTDPMVVMTAALFLFLGISLFLTQPRHEGKRIALLTILCSLFLAMILVTGLFAKNAHWRNLRHEPETTLTTSTTSTMGGTP